VKKIILHQKKILINIFSLKSKIDNKLISNILDEAQLKNIEPIPIDDNFFSNLFNCIDMIINSSIGIIFLDLYIFEDEFDFRPYEKLSELINRNYLSYNQLVLSMFSGIYDTPNSKKTIRSLHEFINKKFSELIQNFNLEIKFVSLTKFTDILDYILLLNNNSKDIMTLPNSDYNLDINKISNLNEKFQFFNLYEILSLTVDINNYKSTTKKINYLSEKYNKKKICLDNSLLLNLINS
jgi:hypothetical protein